MPLYSLTSIFMSLRKIMPLRKRESSNNETRNNTGDQDNQSRSRRSKPTSTNENTHPNPMASTSMPLQKIMPLQKRGSSNTKARNNTGDQDDQSRSQRPNPTSANENLHPDHRLRDQRTTSHQTQPNPNRISPFSSPQHHNRHYESNALTHSSRNTTSATHHICSCDQRYRSTFCGLFRKINNFKQVLASVQAMLGVAEEDEMDWEYVDTYLIEEEKIRILSQDTTHNFCLKPNKKSVLSSSGR